MQGEGKGPGSIDDAFGFQANPNSQNSPNQNEKYNTFYLVTNLQKERRKAVAIIVTAILAIGVGIYVIFSLASGEPETKPANQEQIR